MFFLLVQIIPDIFLFILFFSKLLKLIFCLFGLYLCHKWSPAKAKRPKTHETLALLTNFNLTSMQNFLNLLKCVQLKRSKRQSIIPVQLGFYIKEFEYELKSQLTIIKML